jgi:hypothetical protein
MAVTGRFLQARGDPPSVASRRSRLLLIFSAVIMKGKRMSQSSHFWGKAGFS